jgi:hypothetical protein
MLISDSSKRRKKENENKRLARLWRAASTLCSDRGQFAKDYKQG